MFEEVESSSRSCAALKMKSERNLLDDPDDATETQSGRVALSSSKPIANLFPETTVLLADLAGFTAFSATRTPVEVFTLLETIYNSFDVVAKRRRVFKVETIGDCYVACTGLPFPQKNHAVLMARFANDCVRVMGECTHSLIDVLGPDTANLKLRVGMHSGPTTGGVLRGEKGRFQLFGDTVNTAARMESNGIPGRIQVSKTTADLLVAAGKSNWITPRQGRINAKGKGMMLTWWLEVKADQSCDTTSRSDSVLGSIDGCDLGTLQKQIARDEMEKIHQGEEEMEQKQQTDQQSDGMHVSGIIEC